MSSPCEFASHLGGPPTEENLRKEKVKPKTKNTNTDIINPFDDIVLRNEEKVYIERPEYLAKKHLRLNPKALNDQSQEQSKQKKKRGANKLNKKLLSFAGDDDESDTSKSEE